MSRIKIKVCGMTSLSNVMDVAGLDPDYMGFILYHKSPRYVDLRTAEKLAGHIPLHIKKTAVMAEEPVRNAIEIAKSGIFDFIQLHGNEDAEYCSLLSRYASIIKVFRVSDSLPPGINEYSASASFFLFDTAGRNYGGAGRKFNHKILDNYSSETKYLLAGGISPDDSGYIRTIASENLEGVDLNSRFESKAGIKNTDLLRKFIENIRKHEND
jgi:phosphoribosylanthranilate isomerase